MGNPAAAYSAAAETAAEATRVHAATAAMKTSTSMEPAASATLRHRGSCNRERCRDGQRTYHLQICHF